MDGSGPQAAFRPVRQPQSPSRSLYKGAKAYAAINGRDFVTPDDIKEIAPYILTHRITLSNEARFTRKTAEEIITEILNTVPVPPEKENMIYE